MLSEPAFPARRQSLHERSTPVRAAAGFQSVFNKMAHVAAKGSRVARLVTDGDDALMVLPLRDQPWPDTAPLDLRGPVF